MTWKDKLELGLKEGIGRSPEIPLARADQTEQRQRVVSPKHRASVARPVARGRHGEGPTPMCARCPC